MQPPQPTHHIEALSFEEFIALKVRTLLQKPHTPSPGHLHTHILRQVEKALLHEVLQRTGGNRSEAAQILGIHRLTLGKKIRLYGLDQATEAPSSARVP